jgi:mono/diheme cytochrome c family protein
LFRILNLSLISCFLLFTGCSWSTSPQFQLNTEGRNPQSISREQAAAITGTLEKLFGTPDYPAVPEGIDLNLDLLKMAAGPIGSDDADRPWGLYRKHCLACHGLSGDGAGPNAADLNPYPRDFRNGVFKYTSTAGTAKPLKEDLLHTLRNGIPGTAMPSLAKLPNEQIESLVEYVKYLSIRGETELYLLQTIVDEHAALPLNQRKIVADGVIPAAMSWDRAADMAVVPPAMPRADTIEQLSVSIDRGRELFRTMGAQCFLCHGWTGKGDGRRTDLYDDWNKRKIGDCPDFHDNENGTVPFTARFQLPLQSLPARNLTEGVFHGGDRPIDLYRRISVGIKGTPMPAAGPVPGRNGALLPEEVWHVVNYVRSLSKEGSKFERRVIFMLFDVR